MPMPQYCNGDLLMEEMRKECIGEKYRGNEYRWRQDGVDN